MSLKLLTITALSALVATAAPAIAGTSTSTSLVTVSQISPGNYSFRETGFSNGASVTGTFSGADLRDTGQLASFVGDITAFSMSFSGNVVVPAFTADFADLYGLVYDNNGGPLGDGTTGYGEGVLVVTPAGYSWDVGAILQTVCTGSNVCGEVSYNAPPPPVITSGSPSPGGVPEPASWGLMILGLVGLGSALRASRRGRIGQAA